MIGGEGYTERKKGVKYNWLVKSMRKYVEYVKRQNKVQAKICTDSWNLKIIAIFIW